MPRKDIMVDLDDSESASKSAGEINDLIENKGWTLKKNIVIPNEDSKGNKKSSTVWSILTKGGRKK